MTKNVVTLLLFFVFLIGLAFYTIHSFPKRKPVKKSPPAVVQAQREEVNFETLKRKSFEEGWGRNPFFRVGEKAPAPMQEEVKTLPSQPSHQKEEQRPALKLEMILMADAKKVAILSGQFVREGDEVGEEIVTRIDSDKVILQKNGKRRTIKLDPFFSFQE